MLDLPQPSVAGEKLVNSQVNAKSKSKRFNLTLSASTSPDLVLFYSLNSSAFYLYDTGVQHLSGGLPDRHVVGYSAPITSPIHQGVASFHLAEDEFVACS